MTFLLGFDTRVTSEDLNTGAKLNEILKQGAIRSSEQARTKLSVEEFHETLVFSIQKVHGIRSYIHNYDKRENIIFMHNINSMKG